MAGYLRLSWTQGPGEGGGGKAGTLTLTLQDGASLPDLVAVEELLQRLEVQSGGALSKRLPPLPGRRRAGGEEEEDDEYNDVGVYDSGESGGSRD